MSAVDDFVGWLDTLLAEVLEELGNGYTGEIRDPIQSEVQANTVYVTVGEFEDDTRTADQGRTAQVEFMVYVTTAFEPGDDSPNYITRIRRRFDIVRGIQRACTGAPNSLLVNFVDERPNVIDELYASDAAIRVGLQEDAHVEDGL